MSGASFSEDDGGGVAAETHDEHYYHRPCRSSCGPSLHTGPFTDAWFATLKSLANPPKRCNKANGWWCDPRTSSVVNPIVGLAAVDDAWSLILDGDDGGGIPEDASRAFDSSQRREACDKSHADLRLVTTTVLSSLRPAPEPSGRIRSFASFVR
jgi:hypothetical protein